MNLNISLNVCALALFLAPAANAQTYRVAVETNHWMWPGWEQSSIVPTSTRLSVRYAPWAPINFDAEPYSGPHQVDLYSFGESANAVSQSATATAGWLFTDVVFTGPAPNTPVPVRMAFDVFDTLEQGSPNQGPNPGAIWHDVRVYDSSNTLVAYWNPGGPVLSPTWDVVDGPMVTPNDFYLLAPGQIVTGQTYRFDIRIRQEHGGNQGWSRGWSSVSMALQPFVLPAGFTVDSVQANIVNNVWSPSAMPQIRPRLLTNQPIQAGGNLDVFVQDGAANVLGLLAVGAYVTPTAIAFGPWAGLQIHNPIVLGTFFTDTNGDWTTSFALPAGAAGLHLAMQSAVFAGTTVNDVYSTNTVDIDVQ
ncbi:MAG: hypothetical protein KDC98_21110 [Planctomycetes bacterium]|nr:hypothetical protein [Planctomycetota bacterium]